MQNSRLQFNQQENSKNSIIYLDKNKVKLQQKILTTPVFISSNYCKEIEIDSLDKLNKEFIFPLANHDNIDLLIVGTGDKTKFLNPKQLLKIKKIGINIESMNNKSACYSFNLLLSDSRLVGLLLL
jgi:uncharacterized protein